MPQPTLNDSIDGGEFKQIVLKRIGEAMDRDSVIGQDIEHPRFRFKIEVQFPGAHVKETLVWGQEGATLTEEDNVQTVVDSFESISANQTREDHDMPVPVMIQTPNGPEKRRIHVNPTRPKSTSKPADAPVNTSNAG